MTKRQALAILTLFYAPMLTAQTAPNWKQQSPQSFPSERSGHAMAFDSAHSQTVLFGGDSNNVAVNDTWVWDGSNWTEESPQDMPPMRSNAAMAYDSAHGQVVLFGGVADNVALGDAAKLPVRAIRPRDGLRLGARPSHPVRGPRRK
jgi:hypothetical protein